MSNTTEMRSAWGPACASAHPNQMRGAYIALDRVLQKWGYRPRSGVTGAYNCRPITGGTGYSLHSYKDGQTFVFWSGVLVTMAVAVDINWDRNPYGSRLITDMPRGMVDEILAIRTISGHQVWGWGGYYSGNKDAMHFELHATPAQLATGIRTITVPPITTVPDKVRPMFDPPHILQPIVDAKPAPEGGTVLLGVDGSIYAYGGATFFRGMNGSTHFVGRKAARLDYVGDPSQPGAPQRWKITANTGETYFLPVPVTQVT